MTLKFARNYYAEEGLEANESPIYIPPVSDATPEAKPVPQSETQSEAQRRQSPEKHPVKGELVDIGDRRASEEAKDKTGRPQGETNCLTARPIAPPHERGSAEAA
ncbi:hypothetical protein [Streptomyces sp. 1-11]|uniref:hypothetical protein n=1 Tax=Streptomyces sp. 1-11 TaxID=2590549 RepID=UPI00117D418F|nr:hypothetical protein [Streptomyces sp. 1-11]